MTRCPVTKCSLYFCQHTPHIIVMSSLLCSLTHLGGTSSPGREALAHHLSPWSLNVFICRMGIQSSRSLPPGAGCGSNEMMLIKPSEVATVTAQLQGAGDAAVSITVGPPAFNKCLGAICEMTGLVGLCIRIHVVGSDCKKLYARLNLSWCSEEPVNVFRKGTSCYLGAVICGTS